LATEFIEYLEMIFSVYPEKPKSLTRLQQANRQ